MAALTATLHFGNSNRVASICGRGRGYNKVMTLCSIPSSYQDRNGHFPRETPHGLLKTYSLSPSVAFLVPYLLPLFPWADPRAVWRYHGSNHHYALEDRGRLCSNERKTRMVFARHARSRTQAPMSSTGPQRKRIAVCPYSSGHHFLVVSRPRRVAMQLMNDIGEGRRV